MPGVDALAQALGCRVQAAPVCSSPIGAGQGQVVAQLVGWPQDAQGVVLQLLHTSSAAEDSGLNWGAAVGRRNQQGRPIECGPDLPQVLCICGTGTLL